MTLAFSQVLWWLGPIAVGAGIGAALGRVGSCSTGACPLTANWRRGALYGAVLGLLVAFNAHSG